MRKMGGGVFLDSVQGRVPSDGSDTESEREYVVVVKSSRCVLFWYHKPCYNSCSVGSKKLFGVIGDVPHDTFISMTSMSDYLSTWVLFSFKPSTEKI